MHVSRKRGIFSHDSIESGKPSKLSSFVLLHRILVIIRGIIRSLSVVTLMLLIRPQSLAVTNAYSMRRTPHSFHALFSRSLDLTHSELSRRALHNLHPSLLGSRAGVGHRIQLNLLSPSLRQRKLCLRYDFSSSTASTDTNTSSGKSKSTRKSRTKSAMTKDLSAAATADVAADSSFVPADIALAADVANISSRDASVRLMKEPPASRSSTEVLERVSSIDNFIDQVLAGSKSIHSYWIPRLRAVDRPSARSLIPQLTPDNALAYSSPTGPARKGTLLEYVMKEKKRHSDKVLLVRVGDFYESYGIDAIMLVQYAGLNPMGGRARAGCPIRNIQATLDGLTSSGLAVAIYEELNDVNAARGPSSKAGLKRRTLSQIVSPGASTYLYDLRMRHENIDFKENRPAVGIAYSEALGYSMCEVHLDERVMYVSERLTDEAVRIALECTGCIEPVYLQDVGKKGAGVSATSSSIAHVLPAWTEAMSGYSIPDFYQQVLQRVGSRLEVPIDGFRVLKRPHVNRPAPVYASTAAQIGLLPNPNVPDLIPHLLPRDAPAHASRLLRRWLITPPPVEVADHFRSICTSLLSNEGVMLPSPVAVVPVGKLVSVLRAGESNVALFRDIHATLRLVVTMLEEDGRFSRGVFAATNTSMSSPASPEKCSNSNDKREVYSSMIDSLAALATFESGMAVDCAALLSECRTLMRLIEGTVDVNNIQSGNADADSSGAAIKGKNFSGTNKDTATFSGSSDRGDDDGDGDDNMLFTLDAASRRFVSRDAYSNIPESFFDRNEAEFRTGCALVRGPNQPRLRDAFASVDAASVALSEAVKKHFPPACGIAFDVFNNFLSIKKLPEDKKGVDYIAAIDRFGKPVSRRWTTAEVEKTRLAYLEATNEAIAAVGDALRQLSADLAARLIPIVQSTHWVVLAQTAQAHVVSSRRKGWCVPTMADAGFMEGGNSANASISCFSVKDLSPYWIDRLVSVKNSFNMSGLLLLTAPNMSGKSTLMRSSLVVALLANCGLMVPCSSAVVPRYDCFFLRTASFDVPSEGKSAFALEMEDVRIVLRDATSRSIVMVDELGKGTSARDGAAMAGALLEELDSRGCTGIFATHLHELFDLPLELRCVQCRRMGINVDTVTNEPVWTYKLEDGVCTDSLALQTARKFMLPEALIRRAQFLSEHFDAHCRTQGGSTPSSSTSCSSTTTYGSACTNTVINSGAKSNSKRFHLRDAEKILRSCLDQLGCDRTTGLAGYIARGGDANTHPDDVFVGNGRSSNSINGDPGISSDHADASPSIPMIVTVRHDQEPPVAMEGRACVYLLRIRPQMDDSEVSDELYVGETESLQQRLRQHRAALARSGHAYRVACIAAALPHKSAARLAETALIRAIQAAPGAAVLRSDADKSHALFGHFW